MTNGALINKIKTWLQSEEEVVDFKELPDPKFPGTLITLKYRNRTLVIFFPDNRLDSFGIVNKITVGKKHLIAQRDRYDETLRKQKLFDFMNEFIKYPSQVKPDVDSEAVVRSIDISDVLWEDGLNKNVFFHSLIDIVKSSALVYSYINLEYN